MLVDREFEILAHNPRPFWKVVADFEHAGQAYQATWFDSQFSASADAELKDDRIFDEARATAIAASVVGRSGLASETRRPSRESAPTLFNLTSLQREGNRRFGWSARRTLSAAQRCYERHKILTYPRTDSHCLPNDYREVVEQTLVSLGDGADHPGEGFADYAAAARHLQQAGLENTGRIFDDSKVSDHFAVIPTGTLPETPLTGDDKRLFDLVMRRFLGAFYPPAVWERVERTTEVDNEKFRTRARSLKEKGWRAVLPPSTEDPEELLPALLEGESDAEGVSVRNQSAEPQAEETRPPARITEARLLSLMENAGKLIEDEDHAAAIDEKGIGTPATRADVIENLIAKGYVVRLAKSLRPTVKGIRLIDTLHRIDIARLTSPELTGEIEHRLIEVERGERPAADFMDEITSYACEIVDRAKTFDYEDLYDTKTPLGSCPSCGKPVFELAWFYRCAAEPDVAREDDCPMRFWKDTAGRYLDKQSVETLLRDDKTGTLDGFTARNGRTYKGFIELDREEWKLVVRSLGYNEGEGVSDLVDYDVNPDPLARCPFEEECSVVESPTQFICERELKEDDATDAEERPKSCGFVFPRTVCKREITREEAEVYLANGKTDLLEEFTSRFGRPFSANLVLKKNGRHGFEFPPRKPRAGKAAGDGEKAAPRKKSTRKKKTAAKSSTKKTTRKKAKAVAAKPKTAKGKPATRKKAAVKKKVSKKAAASRRSARPKPGSPQE
jgi:DNA topoisomerase-3